MLYLIGGVARAGKSTIARAMLTEAGVPYLGVDYIKMAFAKAMPDIGIDPNNNDLHTARQLWSFVEAMGEAMIENDQDYTLEAAYILPEYVDSLLKARGNLVRACFVGFERIETSRKRNGPWEESGLMPSRAAPCSATRRSKSGESSVSGNARAVTSAPMPSARHIADANSRSPDKTLMASLIAPPQPALPSMNGMT